MPEYEAQTREGRSEQLFMVRLWREPGDRPQLRGIVEEVGAGQRYYFSSLSELNEFIRLRLR
jgi:hypothetical protein